MTRASASAFWLSLTIVVSLGLYHTSYRVDDMEQQLMALNEQIQEEKQAIHILRAEWDYLSNPVRIESAARKHLSLAPTSPAQVTKMRKLTQIFPTRKEERQLAQKAHDALSSRLRAAAHTPKVSSHEANRINKRITIQAASHRQEPAYPWLDHASYTLANSGSTP